MRTRLSKLVRKLNLFVVAAILTITTSTAIYARPPGIYWIGGTTFISCGSSAGNYIYHCVGSVCTENTGDLNQFIADSFCEQDGGGEGGGPGHGGIQP